MVLALDFTEGIAEDIEKVLVGIEDSAIEVELDDPHGLADGGQLPFEIRRAELLLSDIGGVFHHLERLAVHVQDGIIGGLDPDFLAALADALVLPGIVFATTELLPELRVFHALAVGRVHKHAVVLALNFVKGVAEGIEEVLIGIQDGAVEIELDDRHGFANSSYLSFKVLYQGLFINVCLDPFVN